MELCVGLQANPHAVRGGVVARYEASPIWMRNVFQVSVLHSTASKVDVMSNITIVSFDRRPCWTLYILVGLHA